MYTPHEMSDGQNGHAPETQHPIPKNQQMPSNCEPCKQPDPWVKEVPKSPRRTTWTSERENGPALDVKTSRLQKEERPQGEKHAQKETRDPGRQPTNERATTMKWSNKESILKCNWGHNPGPTGRQKRALEEDRRALQLPNKPRLARHNRRVLEGGCDK